MQRKSICEAWNHRTVRESESNEKIFFSPLFSFRRHVSAISASGSENRLRFSFFPKKKHYSIPAKYE